MSTKAMMGVALALTAVLASPVTAGAAERVRNGAYNAYAQEAFPHARAHARQQSQSVYGTAGQYIGSDPDPFIRDQLARDPSQGGARMER